MSRSELFRMMTLTHTRTHVHSLARLPIFDVLQQKRQLLAILFRMRPRVLHVGRRFPAAPAAAFTTPADVVKTIQQASREQAAGGGGGRRAITMASPPAAAADASAREVVAELVQAEGLGGLYRGALERVLRSAPQFAITLSAFDVLRQAAVDQGLLTIAG